MEEIPGDGGPAFGGIDEPGVVIPYGLEPPDAAKGGELDEEIGVEAEELTDKLVVTVGGGPVYGGSVPPLVSGALPSEREV